MIARARLYDHVPTLTPEEAADLIAQDIDWRRPNRPYFVQIFADVLG